MTRSNHRRTRASITAAALDIAEAEGLNAVTLTRVAAGVGCQPPSLYNHFDALEDLLDEMCLSVVAEFTAVLRDSVMGRSGDEAVRAYANAWRAFVLAHPQRYAAAQRRIPERIDEHREIAEGMSTPVEAILLSLGIEAPDLVHAGRMLRSTLHGFAQLELNATIERPEHSFDAVVAMLIVGLRSSIPAATEGT